MVMKASAPKDMGQALSIPNKVDMKVLCMLGLGNLTPCKPWEPWSGSTGTALGGVNFHWCIIPHPDFLRIDVCKAERSILIGSKVIYRDEATRKWRVES
jgi:hypothetical protein